MWIEPLEALSEIGRAKVVQHDTAMLMIGGGDNNNQAISPPTDLAIHFSANHKFAVAELGMVPNRTTTSLLIQSLDGRMSSSLHVG